MTAAPQRSYRWLFWCLALLGLALDQGSKYGIFAALYNDGAGSRYELVPGVFALTADYTHQPVEGDGWLAALRSVSGSYMPHVNRGALFGLGHGHNYLFTFVSLAAAVAIVCWANTTARRDRWLSTALGLILAGTLGNLYDRLVFDGVRDFLHWYYLVDWPVFNIADCCLVCGASLLLLQAFFLHPAPAPEPQSEAPAEVAEVH